ncbi:hypothetical protein J1614_000084 [Plenodomus biglobosus]|nr:hypothetical protein J1614_000084 [Plenodomus biglobosus]
MPSERIDTISETCGYAWGRKDLDCNLDKAIELVLLYQQENTGGDDLAFAYEQARLAAEAYGLHDLSSKYTELFLGTGPLAS